MSLVRVCAMLALQTGNQPLLGQVAHGPHGVQTPLDLIRPGGRGEEEKTTQKPEVISLASAENLPPVPHFALGCRFLKFSSLQEVQLLSRSA